MSPKASPPPPGLNERKLQRNSEGKQNNEARTSMDDFANILSALRFARWLAYWQEAVAGDRDDREPRVHRWDGRRR